MKQNALKVYAKLKASLEREHATLLARIKEIEATLGVARSIEALETHAQPPAKSKRIRKMSAAGRAAIAAGARARWAKVKAAKVNLRRDSRTAVKPKRRLSAAGKANIIAAAKVRWAKIRATRRRSTK